MTNLELMFVYLKTIETSSSHCLQLAQKWFNEQATEDCGETTKLALLSKIGEHCEKMKAIDHDALLIFDMLKTKYISK
jgi:ferritin